MAEPSVQGRIHSVFWKGPPNRFCPQGMIFRLYKQKRHQPEPVVAFLMA